VKYVAEIISRKLVTSVIPLSFQISIPILRLLPGIFVVVMQQLADYFLKLSGNLYLDGDTDRLRVPINPRNLEVLRNVQMGCVIAVLASFKKGLTFCSMPLG
jgi:hypothetical protein